ncbi:MAG: metallophosphoesterase family protein [Candidatus Bathyarchaeia archaeon]
MNALKPSLVVVEPGKFGRIAVLGDLHGDYKSLCALLELLDLDGDLLVFLGDYADRGPKGVEVIRKVAHLRREHPRNVLALMGNHEDYSDNGEPQFQPCSLIGEAEAKTGSWNTYFRQELKPFIDSLPLCALVPNNALLVHGGVSSKIRGISDLENPADGLRTDLLWSDPMDGEGEEPNWMREVGVMWGSDVTETVCHGLGVERLIRSHQPQLAASKPYLAHDGRVVTVNATSVYGGTPFVYFLDPAAPQKNSFCNI